MDTAQALEKYVQDVTGAPPVLGPAKSNLASLPVYLTKAFDIRKLELFGHSFLVAIVTSDDKIDLAQITRHRELLTEKLDEKIVLVLPHLKSYERRRLIQKQIPFIAPGRQMYLPMLLVDLRESFPAPLDTTRKSLTWVAQVILLRHLLSGDIENRPMAAVALSVGYSAVAISQAVDELIALDLCQRVQKGKCKSIRFQSDPRSLWRSALPFMRSPVKQTHLVSRYDSQIVRPLWAGITALAESTDIADNPIQTLAMSAKDLRNAIKEGDIQTCSLEEDAMAIFQAWAYPPRRLSAGQAVDSLSLYLSMRDEHDERVQIAIAQLVEV